MKEYIPAGLSQPGGITVANLHGGGDISPPLKTSFN
jgi:hypothetical protein